MIRFQIAKIDPLNPHRSVLLFFFLSRVLTVFHMMYIDIRYLSLSGEVYVFPDDLGFWPDAEEIVKLIPVVENFPDVVQVMLGILNDDEKVPSTLLSILIQVLPRRY